MNNQWIITGAAFYLVNFFYCRFIFATKLVSAFWPGPLTLIFNVPSDTFSKTVTGGLETVAFRMPDNQATLAALGHHLIWQQFSPANHDKHALQMLD
jgi:hypothetical protein